jgi:acetyl-CoA C-acetyltransferase
MSRVPMGSDGGAWAIDPAVAWQQYFVPQGVSADLIATLDGYSREQLDAYAVESQHRAGHAQRSGFFDRSIVPVKDIVGETALARDEYLRPTTTLEDLAKLKPAFVQAGEEAGFDAVAIQRYPQIEQIQHLHTAGSSSGIVDGAAAVLVGSRKAAAKAGLKLRARIRAFASIGSEPTIMLTGPAAASRKALKRARMQPGDIDLWEINEAFAAVPLRFMAALDLPPDRVNVNGGAIALGHPLGATGAMILGTVLDELERRELATALVTLCIGAGMGTATIIERI